MESHYKESAGSRYFEWKRDEFLSEEQNKAKAAKFNPYLDPFAHVVDFGCSSGYITHLLTCGERIGVEINATAAAVAKERFQIPTVSNLSNLHSDVYDAAISHHAMEHVENPIGVLKELLRVLKPDGRLIIVVPGECGWYRGFNRWWEEDNKHLFSWTPLTLGNLLVAAGFKIEKAESLPIIWKSRFLGPLNYIPGTNFLMGFLRKYMIGQAEVRVMARKPTSTDRTISG